ncbi:MAG: gliding motility protein GldM [Chitinophagaceae bacterium]|nr:gliding motility protein GldM [Chitinophagaceae bacterium]MCW5903966.1 gliding motility protein GldM [Chitinophagaceae bacterium]
MALPKEPRQKMINLMYLVLTALLALNVSSEILNAFKTVKGSLESSSNLARSKTDQLFESFKDKMEDPKTKEEATLWFEKANQAHTMSEQAFKYVEDLKMELMVEAGYDKANDTSKGRNPQFKEDNLEAATRLLVETAPQGKGKGKELKKKLEDLKSSLLGLDSSVQDELGRGFPIDLSMPKTQSVGNNTWEAAYFRMTPTIAALTILSKFQNDIRNAEAQVVELLHKKVGEVKIKYDQFKAIANASASYVMPGEEIIINAGVGAFSSAAKPSVTIDGAGAQALPDGSYEYKFSAPTAAGEYTKKVRISFIKPDGTTATVDKDIKYTVGQLSGLTVSTDATRVFYAGGIENPLSVTGQGGSEKITLKVDGPGVSVEPRGKGTFIVKCTQPGSAIVRASDGKSTQEFKIPIKRVPNPVIQVNGSAGGSMDAGRFKAAGGVSAKLIDFIFEGYTFKVSSFAMFFTGTGFEEKNEVVEVQGNAFNAEARRYMNRCASGTTVVIGAVRVADQIGNVREIDGTISFTLE